MSVVQPHKSDEDDVGEEDELFLYLSIIYSAIMFISIVMTIPGLYKFT